jgi:hypothetical protein
MTRSHSSSGISKNALLDRGVHAGVVDQDVDLPKGVDCFSRHIFGLTGRRDVDPHGNAVDLPRDLLGGAFLDVGDDDLCALSGQRFAIGAAEADTAAGDDRNLVLKTHIAPSLRF